MKIMVLNDGETWTKLEGCMILEFLGEDPGPEDSTVKTMVKAARDNDFRRVSADGHVARVIARFG